MYVNFDVFLILYRNLFFVFVFNCSIINKNVHFFKNIGEFCVDKMKYEKKLEFRLQKPKKEFKSTLFNIVNEFSLDEFKTFTNFPKVMARALIEKTDSAKLNRLENFIKQNFKVNIPNEKMWKKGAFGSLQLTNEFYASKTAVRIFRKLYGIRNCTVELSDVSSTWEREDVLQVDNFHFVLLNKRLFTVRSLLQLSSDDDDDDVEKVNFSSHKRIRKFEFPPFYRLTLQRTSIPPTIKFNHRDD